MDGENAATCVAHVPATRRTYTAFDEHVKKEMREILGISGAEILFLRYFFHENFESGIPASSVPQVICL